jgi:hypothetical protein
MKEARPHEISKSVVVAHIITLPEQAAAIEATFGSALTVRRVKGGAHTERLGLDVEEALDVLIAHLDGDDDCE